MKAGKSGEPTKKSSEGETGDTLANEKVFTLPNSNLSIQTQLAESYGISHQTMNRITTCEWQT